MPLVSVIIPAYNRAHLIVDAVESVLAQTFKDLEIIAVDDGSEDGTYDLLAARYQGRITLVRQSHQGIAAARNTGIRLAHGKYVAFLDSDDIFSPQKLEKQVAFMESRPEVGFSLTQFCKYHMDNPAQVRFGPDKLSRRFADYLLEKIHGKGFISLSTVMVKRKCLDAVGLFDTEFVACEDSDLWLRLAKRFPYDCLEEVLGDYRIHSQNVTMDPLTKRYGHWQLYNKISRLYDSDLPGRGLIQKHLAVSEYLLGREFLKRGNAHKAFSHIRHAIRLSPFFARHMTENKKSPLLNAWHVIKVYAVLAFSGCRAFMGKLARRTRCRCASGEDGFLADD